MKDLQRTKRPNVERVTTAVSTSAVVRVASLTSAGSCVCVQGQREGQPDLTLRHGKKKTDRAVECCQNHICPNQCNAGRVRVMMSGPWGEKKSVRVTKDNQASSHSAAVQPADVWCSFINSIVVEYEAAQRVDVRAETGTSPVYSRWAKPTSLKLMTLRNLPTVHRILRSSVAFNYLDLKLNKANFYLILFYCSASSTFQC